MRKSSGDANSTDMNCTIPNPLNLFALTLVLLALMFVLFALIFESDRQGNGEAQSCNGCWYDAHLPSVSVVHGKLTGRLGGILVASRLAHLLKVPQAHLALLSQH